MTRPLITRRPRVSIGIALAIAVVGSVGLVLNLLAPAHFDSRAGEVLLLLGVPADALVGAYLVDRRPENPLGHYMVLIALGLGLDSPAKAVLNLGVGGVHGAAMSWSLLVDNSTWTLTYLGVALLILHYPDGELPGARWRWVRRVVVAAWAVLFVVCVLVPTSADQGLYRGVRTPFATALKVTLLEQVYVVPFVVIVAGIVVGVAGLFLRARRARRSGDVVTAAQIRWLAWSGVVAIFLVTSQGWIDPLIGDVIPWLGNVFSELGPYALLVALVVAVTRHGLFEIDRVVSRTASYVVITALLLGTYVAIITSLSALLPTRVNSLVVAAATLAVAALFVPVRRTVQRRIDRRFNRQRHDRARLVERYAESVRRRAVDDDLGTDSADLLAVVHRVLEPQHVGLWLVPR